MRYINRIKGFRNSKLITRNDKDFDFRVYINNNDYDSIARVLSEKNNKIRLDRKVGPEGMSMLTFAACHNNQHILDLLIKNGADINSRTKEGRTALSIVSMNGLVDSAKIIIAEAINNKDINLGAVLAVQDNEGVSPIMMAAARGQKDIVSLLLNTASEHGIDAETLLNAKDKQGNSALMYAIKDNNGEMVDLLIENKADVNVVNNAKVTPLMLAKAKECDGIINSLVNAGAYNTNKSDLAL